MAWAAIAGQQFKRRFFPPVLSLELKSESGELIDVHLRDPQTDAIGVEKARYYHLTVQNSGTSIATNTGVYLTKIMLRGAGSVWHQAWSGDAPLSWRNGEHFPLLREIGASSLDADLFSLVRFKWLELRVAIRPNNLPCDSVPGFPGRWRNSIEMVITVQVKSTEIQSAPNLFHVDWDGGWEDGDAEILQSLRIKYIENIDVV